MLSSQEEVLSNVFWRFLQLRGYINEKHELTSWGESLAQALSVLDPADNLEEPTFLAIEMIRFGVLNTKEWFSQFSGGPMRGTGKRYSNSVGPHEADLVSYSDDDKKYNLLISRVSCIAKLQHKPIGYSGPLSRQLLCYRSLISEVRAALRNLIEVILTGIFLNGDAERDRKDWTEISVK